MTSTRDGVAIIGGTGRLGRALALRWARAGHRVCLGSRSATRAREAAARLGVGLDGAAGELVGASNADAARRGALVVLTVPYAHHASTLHTLAEPLRGALLLDCTVPLHPGPRVEPAHGASAAAEARALLGPDVRLVAGLHTTSHITLDAPDGDPGDALFCGDDPRDRADAAKWLSDLGLRAVDMGPLRHAAALEGLVAAIIHVNRQCGGHAGVRLTDLRDHPANSR